MKHLREKLSRLFHFESIIINKLEVHYGLNIDKRKVRYSTLRADRGGSQVQDQLLAYCWCMRQGFVYGGAVGSKRSSGAVESEQLGKLIGLGLQWSDRWIDPKKILSPEEYRDVNYSEGDTTVLRLEKPSELYPPECLNTLNPARSSHSHECIIHIRRGDVNPERHPDRYLPNSFYLNIIQGIKQKHGEDVDITILSESNSFESWSDFDGIQLVLDAPLHQCWKMMMSAKVLVLSKSAFSYLPAIFCEGEVIYTDFWHAPMPHWSNSQDFLVRQGD